MTAVLRSPSQIPSAPSSPLSCSSNHGSQTLLTNPSETCGEVGEEAESKREDGGRRREEEVGEGEREVEQLSVLAFILTVLRKVRCRTEGEEDAGGMEIGWPTNVRHVAHVTFDRFHGFLGLPVEFEPEVPRRAPSASAKVFGVSTESMQCSYDCRGNSVPTILLLMQRSLYEQGGLRAEGIFRINAENSQEEHVRDQLNSGVVPSGIDVHCLAGLIKAWFRELPSGVLDPLSPERVMQCQTEEDCGQLAESLPPTEASLLNWAINLMADVVQEEHENKMNARNVALVFAPNMTQMADPLTALMYAVQVMNFLKMLILKTIKERQASPVEDSKTPPPDPYEENGHQSPELQLEIQREEITDQAFVSEDPILDDQTHLPEENPSEDGKKDAALQELADPGITESSTAELETVTEVFTKVHVNSRRTRTGQASNSKQKKTRKFSRQSTAKLKSSTQAEKSKSASIVSRINSKSERAEAWR
ncbi:rho GTPase-activating protein 5-like [Phalaenopsis equestris]|uniref:rho GTPase-activating protein 5-like n=1 Tax=Phalaenopsis equestris TaxID=78828 RepID=UPI0009E288D5|nr:rho GTPase-activating protein 5-like [Phalaenopsis equestris]